ncbi:MAG: hypothetical protein J5849_06320 [Clostridia bacterium]|nr:hypothetical protein [Clostridia bacterium]MBR5742744.1 hypothetical protein [Clostridia bacterium]
MDPNMKTENGAPEKEGKGRKVFLRVIYVLAGVIALVPLIAYLILLPVLPDFLPVKYDSMGLPSINVAKTSFHMILFSLEGVIGVVVMMLVGRVAQGFARRTYRTTTGMDSTRTTLAVITLVIAGLLTLSWFLTVIPMLS